MGYCLNSVKKAHSFTQPECRLGKKNGSCNPACSRWHYFNIGIKQNRVADWQQGCALGFLSGFNPGQRQTPTWQHGKICVLLSVDQVKTAWVLLHIYCYEFCHNAALCIFLENAVKGKFPISTFLSLSLLLLSSELPAGSELFYAVVVTGRFIRLEICTNQLSFTASCQCVKLSDLL